MSRVRRQRRGASTRTVFLVIIIVFVLSWIGAAIFGYVVSVNVRKTAKRTDIALRSLTWAALVYACEHQGQFPSSEQELFSTQPLPDSISCVPSEGGDWPSDRSQIMGEDPFPPDLAYASRKLKLYFASQGDMPPVFDANGMPTELGTIDELRKWLDSFAQANPVAVDP